LYNHDADPPITGATPRNNVVQIVDQSRSFSNITYNGFYDVSDGQPAYPPPTISGGGGQWTITFNAGRQNTTPVADKFHALSGGRGHEFSPFDSHNDHPKQLNFFFGVNIQIQSAVVTALLGQGNAGLNNNWWIGSEFVNATPKTGSAQFVCNVGGQIVKLNIIGDAETFTFYVAQDPKE
jgi:hypothetical protein